MDLSGDVIITLSNPNAPFAVWDGSEQGPARAELSVSPKITDPTPPAEDNTIAVDELPAPQDNEVAPPKDSQISSVSTELATFHVSSRRLIWASPVFKAMLTGGWKEGDKNKGPLQGGAEDWDAEALLIVLNVLRSHYR